MDSFDASTTADQQNIDHQNNRLKEIFSEYYFDAQTLPPFSRISSLIDEAALARLLTKLAVGSATVWWSLLEIREMASLYKRSRKNRS